MVEIRFLYKSNAKIMSKAIKKTIKLYHFFGNFRNNIDIMKNLFQLNNSIQLNSNKRQMSWQLSWTRFWIFNRIEVSIQLNSIQFDWSSIQFEVWEYSHQKNAPTLLARKTIRTNKLIFQNHNENPEEIPKRSFNTRMKVQS